MLFSITFIGDPRPMPRASVAFLSEQAISNISIEFIKAAPTVQHYHGPFQTYVFTPR